MLRMRRGNCNPQPHNSAPWRCAAAPSARRIRGPARALASRAGRPGRWPAPVHADPQARHAGSACRTPLPAKAYFVRQRLCLSISTFISAPLSGSWSTGTSRWFNGNSSTYCSNTGFTTPIG